MEVRIYDIQLEPGAMVVVRVSAVFADGSTKPILDDGAAPSMEEALEVARDEIGRFSDQRARLAREERTAPKVA